MRKKLLALVGAATLCGMAAQAAVINWGAPQDIAGDNDVSLQGTLVKAINVQSTNAITLNGVTFAPDDGSVDGQNWYGDFVWDPTTPPVSQEYNALMDAARYDVSTITLSGLTVGQQYLVQVWSCDARTYGTNRTTTLTAGNSVTLDENVANVNGGMGQYVIGTFTADSDTQTISVSSATGADNEVINAYQLRAIPEPSTLGLMGVIGGALYIARRRRRHFVK